MRKLLLSISLFALIALAQTAIIPCSANAVETTPAGDIIVQAEGIGLNPAEAMINAKRAAVEEAIGTVIHSETEVRNYTVHKDVILTRTMGAVRSVKELSRTKDPDGTVTVIIRASVVSSILRDDLAALRILLESMEKPRVMVMIKESNIDKDSLFNSVAETEIIRYLTEKEFELVDPATVERLKKHEQALQAMEGNVQAAAAIGAEAGAEMVITGKAISSVAEGLSNQIVGFNSCQADVSIRVIVCATAKILAAKTGHAAAVHINPQSGGAIAIRKAAKKVMDDYLFEKIVGSWQDIINNGIPLRVIVSNVKSFRISKAVMNAINDASTSIVKVTKRNWNEGTGLLELEVKYKGNSDGFSETIDSNSIPTGGKLLVTGSTLNSVRIKVGQ